MKLLMSLGGLIGFGSVCLIGFVLGHDPGRVVMEASIASVVGAMLCRWLHATFVRSVNTSWETRRKARINEATVEAMKKSHSESAKS